MTRRDSAEVTIVPTDIPFEIMRGVFTHQRFAPHVHDTYAIGTMERGAARVRFKGRTVFHRAGGVVTICPGEVHTGETVDADGWQYRMLYLPSALMARFTGSGVAPAFAESGVHDPELADRIGAAHVLLESGANTKVKALALSGVMELLCVRHALCDVGPRSAPLERMSVVRRCIEERCAHHVSLAELATVAEMNPFQLIREFKRAYGMPPYAYLALTRVTRAREMLQQGAHVADVAFTAGYSDQSHMTRHFKRMLGVTPARYARSYRRSRMS